MQHLQKLDEAVCSYLRVVAFEQFHKNCMKTSYFDNIPYLQGYGFDPLSAGKGMVLVLHLCSQGYGCEKPGPHTTLKFFYPRPVVASGYCRCLRLSIRPSPSFFCTITHHLFKLESPNLNHRCKRPQLRSLLFLGVIDLDLQGQISLQKSKFTPIFSL